MAPQAQPPPYYNCSGVDVRLVNGVSTGGEFPPPRCVVPAHAISRAVTAALVLFFNDLFFNDAIVGAASIPVPPRVEERGAHSEVTRFVNSGDRKYV